MFRPDHVIRGSFSGRDHNGDGIVAKDELSAFILDTVDYMTCAGPGSGVRTCTLERFAFGPDGHLDFATDYLESHYGDGTYLWTDQTVFAIAPAPVPEPSAAAMAGVALLPLLLARLGQAWRRRRLA